MKIYTPLFLIYAFLALASTARGQDILLYEYQTQYHTWGKNKKRAHNIKKAASKINNVILEPGEVFSFNKRVGKRTKVSGFKKAGVISGGRLKKAYGGGVCQVASTIYAAALYSGLQLVEHHNHSRVSSYIPAGLDATVSWGMKDFAFKNSYDFKIKMVITHPEKNQIKVQFFGEKRGNKIKVRIYKKVTKKYKTVYIESQKVKPGKKKTKVHGVNGYYVKVTRLLGEKKETKEMMYYVANEIVLHNN